MNEFAASHKIVSMDDWYSVTVLQLRDFGLGYAVKQFGGLYEILRRIHPNHSWQPQLFTSNKLQKHRNVQHKVDKEVRGILPSSESVKD